MCDMPDTLRAKAVLTGGTAWAVNFHELTEKFISGFSIVAYLTSTPQHNLPFFVTEIFLTKGKTGWNLELRFNDTTKPNPIEEGSDVTVQIYYPAP